MIKSMTGYGKAEQIIDRKKITVELRSLNSKTLDLNIKLPAPYREQEHLLRNELFRIVQRGKLEVSVTVASQDDEPLATINKSLFVAYYRQMEELLNEVGARDEKTVIAPSVLRLPDVLETVAPAPPDEEWEALFACLRQALAAFDRFRTTEGAALMNDILTHVAEIDTLLDDVKTYEPQRVERLRQRMEANLTAFLQGGQYDQNRFEQELIYYLEKIDITEEKIRLRQHCLHFRQTVGTEEAPGRKLGFIAQEMGREINTLGSKANHAEIQKIVVQMKDELEKVKEQLLNVL
jgi:uncharacterized protein (TIGR00255 family)